MKIFSLPIFAGILFFDDKNHVISTVSPQGKITLKSKKKEGQIFRFANVPFLRGIEFAFVSTILFFKGLQQSFYNANQNTVFKDEQVLDRKNLYLTTILIFLAVLSCFYLVGLLSAHIGFVVFPNSYSFFVKNVSIAFVRVVFVFLLLYGLAFIPFIKELWKYNQAGNEAVTGNKHRALNYFNILISSLLISIFVVSLMGLNLGFGWKVLVNIAILLIAFSLVFELSLLAEGKQGYIYKIIAIFGVLTTAKPAKTEIQVVLGAYNEVLLMQEEKGRENINIDNENIVSFSSVLGEVKTRLAEVGINDRSEAEWLIANVLRCKRFDLKLLYSVTKTEEKEIFRVLERRVKGEPLEKIFGETEFYGLRFVVNKNVLTPRNDTEILVEEAIKLIGDKKAKVLDLCTGSGAIAITIAKNTKANVVASDISEKALEVAKHNAKNNNVEITFKQGDLFDKIGLKKFDFILSNPPYIKSSDIQKLDREVKDFDPIIALDGGESGFDFYEKIIQEAPKHLTKSGVIILEIGKGQASKIKKLLTNDFINIRIIRDYNNIQRVVIAEKRTK